MICVTQQGIAQQNAAATAKAVTGQGAVPGPGAPLEPGTIEPSEFGRPYLTEGHAAPSPAYTLPDLPPAPPHTDLTGSRALARPVFPDIPMGPSAGAR